MLRRFFGYYAPWKGLFFLDFGCAILSGLLELGFPMAVRAFVDNLLPTGNWPLIVAASIGLLVIYAINTGLMAVVTYWGHMLGINIETEMRRKSFDHLQSCPSASTTTTRQAISSPVSPRISRRLARWRIMAPRISLSR